MIKNIQLYTERHTGSKWLTKLICDSFGFNENDLFKLGWKHWFPVIDNIETINKNEYLFIVLSRNPYNWIKSMHESPHHSHISLKNISIDKFIKKEWQCTWDKISGLSDLKKINTEMMHERNPKDGKRIKNIIELRNLKNESFLDLENRVKYVYYLKYEDLLMDPLKILKDISIKYNIPMKSIEKINTLNKKDKKLNEDIIKFINNNLNWDLEEKIGYYKNIIK